MCILDHQSSIPNEYLYCPVYIGVGLSLKAHTSLLLVLYDSTDKDTKGAPSVPAGVLSVCI